MRGSASCNLTDRILEVPLGPGEQARAVRAHELMHARVSPYAHHLLRALDEVSPRALECAEELRVNTLLARLGFNLSVLCDGTEKVGAKRLAIEGLWAEAVCFMLAVLGTGAEREFFAGIRQGNSSWTSPLRAVKKRALVILDQSTESMARREAQRRKPAEWLRVIHAPDRANGDQRAGRTSARDDPGAAVVSSFVGSRRSPVARRASLRRWSLTTRSRGFRGRARVHCEDRARRRVAR